MAVELIREVKAESLQLSFHPRARVTCRLALRRRSVKLPVLWKTVVDSATEETTTPILTDISARGMIGQARGSCRPMAPMPVFFQRLLLRVRVFSLTGEYGRRAEPYNHDRQPGWVGLPSALAQCWCTVLFAVHFKCTLTPVRPQAGHRRAR